MDPNVLNMPATAGAAPTPLKTGDAGVYTEAGASLMAVQAILGEAWQLGMLGFDLEWAPDGRITWIGLGTPYRAISLWRPTLPEATMALIRTAIADPNFPKLAHNCQADIQRWEAEEGPVGGEWHDSMLAHHAAYPGLAHDLQNVVSQFCVVPPWKVWHKQAQEAAAAREKAFRKEEKRVSKETAKAEKEAAREADKALKRVKAFHTKGQKAAETFIAKFQERHDVGEVRVALEVLLATDNESDANLRCDRLINFIIPHEKDRIRDNAKRLKAEAHLAHNDPAAAAAETPKERTGRKRRQATANAPELDARQLPLAPAAPPVIVDAPVVDAPVVEAPRFASNPHFHPPSATPYAQFPKFAKRAGTVSTTLVPESLVKPSEED